MGTLSNFFATIILTATMMGTGINFMPLAYKQSGYLLAPILITTVGILTFLSLYSISYATSNSKESNPTFSSIAESISKYLKWVVDASIISGQFLASLAFYRYLSQLFVLAIPKLEEMAGGFEKARKAVVLTLSMPFFAMISQKDLSSLRFTSYITVFSVLYLAVLLMIYVFTMGNSVSDANMEQIGTETSNAISYFLFALACQPNMVKIYSEMNDKSLKGVVKVTLGASVLGVLIYGSVGSFGYYLLGGKIDKSIIDYLIDPNSKINIYLSKNTIDTRTISSKAACFTAMLVLFGSFPLQVSPITLVCMERLSFLKASEKKLRLSIVTSMMILYVALSIKETLEIKKLVTFSGATSCNLLAFTIPFIFYAYTKKKLDLIVVGALILSALSVIMMIWMVYGIFK